MGRSRGRSTNKSNNPWKPSDIEHLTSSPTPLSNSPCAQCSTISEMIVCVINPSPLRGCSVQSCSRSYRHMLKTFPTNFHRTWSCKAWGRGAVHPKKNTHGAKKRRGHALFVMFTRYCDAVAHIYDSPNKCPVQKCSRARSPTPLTGDSGASMGVRVAYWESDTPRFVGARGWNEELRSLGVPFSVSAAFPSAWMHRRFRGGTHGFHGN